MLGCGAGRSFSEKVRNGQETTHAGADHHGASEGRGRSGEGQDGEDGDPVARDQRADVLAVAEGVRGDEGGLGASIQGAAKRERTTEASGGKPDAGHADPGGSGQGKLLSPERRHRCVVQVRADEAALRTDVMRLASRYGYRRIITAAPATALSLADYVLHPPPRLLIGQRAPAAAHVLGEVLGVRRGRDGTSNRRVREDVLEEELTPRLAVER